MKIYRNRWNDYSITKKVLLSLVFCVPCILVAQTEQKDYNSPYSSEQLLMQYVQSQGSGIISFDASNIKQFWIDTSVVSRNNTIEVFMQKKITGFESVPLKIQLVNVDETQDCKVSVISETEDIAFSVLNSKKEVLSSSKEEDAFLNYAITSSVFHLENTPNISFNIRFNSQTTDILSIKKILLSFTKNKDSIFLSSPGILKIRFSDIIKDNSLSSLTPAAEKDEASFSITGKRSRIFTTKQLLVKNTPLEYSVTIKNTGNNPTQIFTGYKLYNKEHVLLDGKNYPYKNTNNILKIISAPIGSTKIIVNTYPEWGRACYLALNAKEDMSDIPNTSFVNGVISEVQKLENGYAEITLTQPLKEALAEGTNIRVHGSGGGFFYTSIKTLQPGNEAVFSSTVEKDEKWIQYTQKFSRGVYYVLPIILSYSLDASQENTILVSDFIVSF